MMLSSHNMESTLHHTKVPGAVLPNDASEPYA